MQKRAGIWLGFAFAGLAWGCSSGVSISAGGGPDASVSDASPDRQDGAVERADTGTPLTADAGPAPDAGDLGDPNLESPREARVRELVNAVRQAGASCGATAFPPVAPLGFNALLAQAARAHSADMCARQYFDHNNPDGKTPFDRIKAAGYQYSTAGENIAAGQTSPEAVMDGWMHSEGHCKNIMNANYKELGVGYSVCTDQYIHYWTQNFGAKQ